MLGRYRFPLSLPSLLSLASASILGAQMPAPRAGHGVASAGPAGGVLLVGGQILDNTPRLVDSLWLWSGSAWRVLSDDGPRSRTMPAVAFDTRRRMLVVYGGIGSGSGTRFGDTWEWDGARWHERNVRTPGPRDHHAMAYDEARGKTVMYGGQDDRRSFPRETWTWDGATWTLADSMSGPGGLVHHAMAYDGRRQRVVMYGGYGASSQSQSDIWEWDGTKWERITSVGPGPGPGPRARHRLAFDAARGVTVLFGGGGDVRTGSDDTWTWDGRSWTLHTVPGPPKRFVHAMAYDGRRERVILFGGAALDSGAGAPPYGYLNDVWEWDGARWERRD